jgi:hypothetical protein
VHWFRAHHFFHCRLFFPWLHLIHPFWFGFMSSFPALIPLIILIIHIYRSSFRRLSARLGGSTSLHPKWTFSYPVIVPFTPQLHPHQLIHLLFFHFLLCTSRVRYVVVIVYDDLDVNKMKMPCTIASLKIECLQSITTCSR